MDYIEFKKDLIDEVKAASIASGEGSVASFVQIISDYLIDADVIPDFTSAFCTGKFGRSTFRVDGYIYDEFDNSINLIIADFDGFDLERRLTATDAERIFSYLTNFLNATFNGSLQDDIEISDPASDLVDYLISNKHLIRKYRFFLFTDAEISHNIKVLNTAEFNGVTIEKQIWNTDRIFRVCCSEERRQSIEINFKKYCADGIPCLIASDAATDQYTSYLGVISGDVLADIYDEYGSRLLESNVRSFLSTKVAVNKKIRATILKSPKMFFAFNNGISVTCKEVSIEKTECGNFITSAKDFQIINGGQTTASISNTRYKDKASLKGLYVQMKLTSLDGEERSTEDAEKLIRDISRSSNSQNKVSDADFFASHPFHIRMEQLSRIISAPAKDGAQFETKWFYERARGQYLQEQIRLTPAKKRQFQLLNPKSQVIKKIDLAKVQECWLGHPDIVSKGAQTNFKYFAEHIDDEWSANQTKFNERYFKSTASLVLIFHFLEQSIPKQNWYKGGYRANIIYYTVALLKKLLEKQYTDYELDLIKIWLKQNIPETLRYCLLSLAQIVQNALTSDNRKVQNVTQWCKKEACWDDVQKIDFILPPNIKECLIDKTEAKAEGREARNDQRTINSINSQTEVVNTKPEIWKHLLQFCQQNQMISRTDAIALTCASKIPINIPNPRQCKRILELLEKAKEEGFISE